MVAREPPIQGHSLERLERSPPQLGGYRLAQAGKGGRLNTALNTIAIVLVPAPGVRSKSSCAPGGNSAISLRSWRTGSPRFITGSTCDTTLKYRATTRIIRTTSFPAHTHASCAHLLGPTRNASIQDAEENTYRQAIPTSGGGQV